MLRNRFLLVVAGCLWAAAAFAQRPDGMNIGYKHYTGIRIDFKKGIFDPISVPFDVPFEIYGTIPPEIKRITCTYNDKKTPGSTTSLEWNRNIFNTSATGANDTFYFVVGTPLKAIHEYAFKFKFYRSVTATEAGLINSRVKPFILTRLGNIYANAVAAGNSGSQLATDLQDAANTELLSLQASLATEIINYYAAQNITVTTAAANQVVAAGLPGYIRTYYFEALLNRLSRASNVETIINTSGSYLSVATDPLPAKLYAKAAALNVPQPLRDALRDTLLNQGNLAFLLRGLDNPLGSGVTDLGLTAADLSNRVLILGRLKAVLQAATRQLEDIHNNEDAFGKLGATEAEYTRGMATLGNATLYCMGLEYAIAAYQKATAAVTDAFAAAQMEFNSRFPIEVEIPGLTTAEFITRGEWYITADLGFACVFVDDPTAKIRPYLGANFNFFPINRQANYSVIKSLATGDFSNVLKGMSGVVGVTVVPFDDKDSYTDLFASSVSLLTGLGLRVTDGIRLSGGWMWAYRKDPNQLIDKKYLNASPYIALSLDWDLRQFIRNITGRVTGFSNL